MIEIPGEPDFFKTTNLPSEEVRLPATFGSRWRWWLMVPISLFGLMFSFGAAALLLEMPRDAGFGPVVAQAVLGLFMAATGICFIGNALTAIIDDCRRYPLLALDESGLWDKRSLSAPVAWSDIAHAKVIYTKVGVAGVFLKLRRTIEARHNPFRLGTLGFSWRRRPDELHVPVMGLDAKPRLLALAITTMVQRNGGAIDTKHPYAGTSL